MARRPFSTDGFILHFGSVRMRVTGSGNLQSSLESLDSIRTSVLPNVAMAATTNREPTILSNFREQRARLILTTTAIDESFSISKIVVYVKQSANGYPQ